MTGTLMALAAREDTAKQDGAQPDPAAVHTYAAGIAGREKSFYGRAVKLSLST